MKIKIIINGKLPLKGGRVQRLIATGLHKSFHPTIRDGSTWNKFGARGEHGDVFLFSNSQEQFFFLQTLLYKAFLVTVIKLSTYALVST